MKLLSSTETNTNKQKSDGERERRIKRMNEEETQTAKKLNKTKVFYEAEKERMASELITLEKTGKEKKAGLISEIKALEARKAEALKPATDQLRFAEQRMKEVEKKEKALVKREAGVKDAEAAVVIHAEKIADAGDQFRELTKTLDKTKADLKIEKERIKKSHENLAAKWVEYHAEIQSVNITLTRREKDVEAGKRANELYAQSLTEQQTAINKDRRAISDGYASLQKAREEILGRST